MTAPKHLRRGNAFQEIVQADFIANTKGGRVEREYHIDFGPHGIQNHRAKNKIGRVDIWIEDRGDDAIAVFEIKATDWDLITPRNLRRNIYRHQKQLFDYVLKYNFRDNLQVTYGLIYPYPPEREGLRDEIEELAMMTYQVPIYWYIELNPEFNPLLLLI
jgi:hypothetical protein